MALPRQKVMAQNLVDEFEVLQIKALEDNDYSRWMENLPNEKQLSPLKDLVIPGSHDSGTFFLDQNMEIGPDESSAIHTLGSIFGKVAKSVIHSWSVTQSMTIYEQLLSGIRYLDLRVAYRAEDKKIRVVHGLFGWTIDQVLDEVNRFVANYPKEIVILDFNHFYKMDQAAHETLADTLLASFSEIFRAPGADGPNVTLQEMWGNEEKVIIIYHDYDVVDTYPCFWPPHLICSPWPNTADKKLLLEFLNKQSEASSFSEDALQVTQAILTPQTSTVFQNMTSTLKDVLASRCNCYVTGWLKALCGTKCHKFNIIIADFVEFGDFIPTLNLSSLFMDSWHILYQTVSSDSFTEIKREISRKLVLCNEAMIQGLYKSGVVEPLETIKIDSREEIVVLQHVEKLIKLCKLEFCMATIDISENWNCKCCRFKVSWSLGHSTHFVEWQDRSPLCYLYDQTNLYK
ncbi:unnamed protein product, partial [Pocillopora meandrina]